MEKLFAEWDYILIEKALFRFMTNDAKGFPPVPGQLITLAAEIRKMEWDKKKREIDQLPEPQINAEPMPEELKQKLSSWLKGTGI